MGEQRPSPEDPLLAQFGALMDVAHNNPFGTGAWLETTTTPAGETSFRAWQLSHAQDLEEQRSGLSPLRRYHYTVWNVTNNELQEVTRDGSSDATPSLRGGDPLPYLTVPQVCYTFLRRAETRDQLGTIVEAYVDWAQTNTEPAGLSGTSRVAGALIGRSLIDQPELFSDPESPVLRALARLQPGAEDYGAFSSNLSTMAASILAGKRPKNISLPKPEEQSAEENRNQILSSVRQLTEIGILGEQFWFDFGVRGGGTFIDPDILELTQVVLQDEASQAFFASLGSKEKGRDLIRDTRRNYVGRLLESAASDGRHEGTKIQEIIGGVTDGNLLRLDLLVKLANGVTTVLNEDLTRAGAGPEAMLSELDARNWPPHLGGALVRVLKRFRRHDLPDAERARLDEIDAAHVSIVELLGEVVRDRPSVSPSDLRLRHPEATEAELAEMMGQLNQGRPPAKVYAVYRARQRPNRKVGRWGIWESGRGLLS